MKPRLFIFATLFILIAILIGLNAASYTQSDTLPDGEEFPHRSTYNPGATGSRAFYELLAETGKNVTRWQENPAALLGAKNSPETLVLIGGFRREPTAQEIEQILTWVANGGKLVLIDRYPAEKFLETTNDWKMSTISSKEPTFAVNSADQLQMTDKTLPAKALQPTVLTRGVNAVQPSRFASAIKLDYVKDGKKSVESPLGEVAPILELQAQDEPPPRVVRNEESRSPGSAADAPEEFDEYRANAPFIHLKNPEKAILADFSYGAGRIVVLTDPYIVSNAGIGIVDNAQLAVNLVASSGNGRIAFNEYHHGYGATENRLLQYFAGTPVLWLAGQFILLIMLILWSQSRRFSRPLPANEPSRLSKLEYVSAFAELQQRTKAYDLALENIYSEFRRSTARLFGMDNFTASRQDLAKMIAERGKFNELEIYNLMKDCEEIIQGAPTNKKEIVALTAQLREIQKSLGIKRAAQRR